MILGGRAYAPPTMPTMWILLIILLVIWLAFAIVGFIIEGLLWLAFIAIVLIAATAAWGWLRAKTSRDTREG